MIKALKIGSRIDSLVSRCEDLNLRPLPPLLYVEVILFGLTNSELQSSVTTSCNNAIDSFNNQCLDWFRSAIDCINSWFSVLH